MSIPNKTCNSNEDEYLKVVNTILNTGVVKDNTLAVFGTTCRYSLSDGKIPLLTTRKMFWKGIVNELLWFISGSTSSTVLSSTGVRIWDANAAAHAARSLDVQPGDLGPVYGFQWRHYGATYTNCNADYTNQGIDQLSACIRLLQTNPTSRRNIMCSWNPIDIPRMALPPCHCLVQFCVDVSTHPHRLTVVLYQRSGDIALGVPFNIASYSLLAHMICSQCVNMVPYELVHIIGDAQIYDTHIDGLRVQLERTPLPCPTVVINQTNSIFDITSHDIVLADYTCHPHIPFDMCVT